MEMRPKALIVEDEVTTATLLKRLVIANGCDAEIAPDGETALQRLAAVDFDVVLLDIILPRISGIHVMDWLRDHKPEMLERIIVVTGVDLNDIRRLFPTVCHVLGKPVMPSRLLQSIQKCLVLREPPWPNAQFTRG
jgi:CheY-like chemotaxis protein